MQRLFIDFESSSDKILSVDKQLLSQLTFEENELVGFKLPDVLNDKLRMPHTSVGLLFIQGNCRTYIFTKHFAAIEVEAVIIREEPIARLCFEILPDPGFKKKCSYFSKVMKMQTRGIAVYTTDAFLLDINDAFLKMLSGCNLTREKIVGRQLYDIHPWISGSSYEEKWKKSIFSGEVFYITENLYDDYANITQTLEMTLIPIDEYGNIKYMVVELIDITEKVLIQQKVLEQKELHEAILDNLYDAFFIIDNQGKYLFVNAAAKRMYPELEGLVYAKDLFDLYEFEDLNGNPIDRLDLPTSRAIMGNTVLKEVVVFKKNGVSLICELNAIPVLSKQGSQKCIAVIHRDITESVNNKRLIREQNEKMLKNEIEKNEALVKLIQMKDDFLSLMSHEFRTPLAIINSAIQAMEFLCKDTIPQKAWGFIEKIKQNTYRQMRLVNNLLDITRVNAGRIKLYKKNINIAFAAREITESVSLYAQHKGVKLRFLSRSEEINLFIDEEKFERILLNLISNAIKFTPKNKSIIVRVGKIGNHVYIKVKDNGIGIPPEKLEIVFEKFGQVDSSLSRQSEGTGMGLSIVKLFVEALGGKVYVTSRVCKGSSFVCLFPEGTEDNAQQQRLLKEMTDNKLIESIAIEFSDVYL